jgi:phage tail sheath gpL-like
MSVPFNSIPTNLRVPFFAVEFDSSRATEDAELPYRALLIGQKLSGGTATANSFSGSPAPTP